MSEALQKISVIPQDEPSSQVPALANWMTPMSMLDRAISGGASIEVLEKLMGLQERHEANHARKAFDEAVAAAKAAIPPIARNATGHNAKKYADFSAIAKVVDPIIGAHGLSYRFRTTQTDKISVTCILSHKSGHSEETTLAGPADATGNKNAIQAIGSTLSYLQRYSLVQMLGIAVAADDDGKGAGSTATITQAQADTLRDLIEANGKDRAAFLKWAARSDPKVERIEDIAASAYDSCVQAIQYKAPAK